jgi:hypothetical protein
MSGKVVFLLEEPSMKAFLDRLLPRLFSGWIEGQHFKCMPHEGKSDLDRSISNKLRAWREPNTHFVIVRDNDNADCIEIKEKLRSMCCQAGRPGTLIRLVCQELESWYLGDLDALGKAYSTDVNTSKNKKRFANPDMWQKPSCEVKRLISTFQKYSGARKLAEHLNIRDNRSPSFRIFVEGVSRLHGEL